MTTQLARPVPITRIVDLVCERFGVTREELAGKGRHPLVSLARQCIGALARMRSTSSFPEISREIGSGNGSHSGVHAAQKRLDRGDRVPENFPMDVKTVGGCLDALVLELDAGVAAEATVPAKPPPSRDEKLDALVIELMGFMRRWVGRYEQERNRK